MAAPQSIILRIPETPDPLLSVHTAATAASLAAGAITYVVASTSGKAATCALTNSVRFGGFLCAQAGRLIVGDSLGLAIQLGTNTAAAVLESAGSSATNAGSFLASSVVAAAVGSTVLIGNTLYSMYCSHKNGNQSQLKQQQDAIAHEVEEVRIGNSVVYLLEDKKPEPPIEVQQQPQDESDRTGNPGAPEEGVSE